MTGEAAGPGPSHRPSPTLAGAQANRLGADGAVRLEAGDRLDRDWTAQHSLNLAKERRLVDADE